jgi:hypothetical protein
MPVTDLEKGEQTGKPHMACKLQERSVRKGVCGKYVGKPAT